jgi:hypothetical protein
MAMANVGTVAALFHQSRCGHATVAKSLLALISGFDGGMDLSLLPLVYTVQRRRRRGISHR